MTESFRTTLIKCLDYNPETGKFIWKIDAGDRVKGDEAGSYESTGYIKIQVDGIRHYAHKLAWLYVFDEWPSQLDHINRERHDNRIVNLRIATSQQNAVNRDTYDNKAGATGVYRSGSKYCTKIKVGGKQIHLGTFKTLEEASKVYQEARIKYFGEFANA